jgi:hypothetical protein
VIKFRGLQDIKGPRLKREGTASFVRPQTTKKEYLASDIIFFLPTLVPPFTTEVLYITPSKWRRIPLCQTVQHAISKLPSIIYSLLSMRSPPTWVEDSATDQKFFFCAFYVGCVAAMDSDLSFNFSVPGRSPAAPQTLCQMSYHQLLFARMSKARLEAAQTCLCFPSLLPPTLTLYFWPLSWSAQPWLRRREFAPRSFQWRLSSQTSPERRVHTTD